MHISVVIPTYNRLPILRKCLLALERQTLAPPLDRYEVVVVDDGSTDDTIQWLDRHAADLPHVRLIRQEHGGPAEGRNRGVDHAHGDVIVFIDSDLVVTDSFLISHARALDSHWTRQGDRLCFTYGAVINTANFDEPTAEPHKLSDLSWAYFATGNVGIDRAVLERAGLFDTSFRLYGWEDLELGERLRRMGVVLVRCPEAARVFAADWTDEEKATIQKWKWWSLEAMRAQGRDAFKPENLADLLADIIEGKPEK